MDIKNNSCKDYTSDFIRVIKKNYIDFLEEINKKGQPILVGTKSPERNEYLGKLLEVRGIPHNILNAKNTISIHIRRGDLAKKAMGGNGIAYRLPISYYYNAINYINNLIDDPLYVLFMEHNEDQFWCKKNIVSGWSIYCVYS